MYFWPRENRKLTIFLRAATEAEASTLADHTGIFKYNQMLISAWPSIVGRVRPIVRDRHT